VLAFDVLSAWNKKGNNYFGDEFFARLDQLARNLIKRCEKLMDSTLIEFRVLEEKIVFRFLLDRQVIDWSSESNRVRGFFTRCSFVSHVSHSAGANRRNL
jgi:hypothetical protein